VYGQRLVRIHILVSSNIVTVDISLLLQLGKVKPNHIRHILVNILRRAVLVHDEFADNQLIGKLRGSEASGGTQTHIHVNNSIFTAVYKHHGSMKLEGEGVR
jgi:hypothetical protein